MVKGGDGDPNSAYMSDTSSVATALGEPGEVCRHIACHGTYLRDTCRGVPFVVVDEGNLQLQESSCPGHSMKRIS